MDKESVRVAPYYARRRFFWITVYIRRRERVRMLFRGGAPLVEGAQAIVDRSLSELFTNKKSLRIFIFIPWVDAVVVLVSVVFTCRNSLSGG